MECEHCGREISSAPILHRSMDQEFAFCSGRCAAAFDQRLVDALIRMAVPDAVSDEVSLLPGLL